MADHACDFDWRHCDLPSVPFKRKSRILQLQAAPDVSDTSGFQVGHDVNRPSVIVNECQEWRVVSASNGQCKVPSVSSQEIIAEIINDPAPDFFPRSKPVEREDVASGVVVPIFEDVIDLKLVRLRSELEERVLGKEGNRPIMCLIRQD